MSLGRTSILRLATCDVRLQQLVTAVAADVDAGVVPGVNDLTVLCGHRGEADQEAAFKAGASKLHWPNSKHNSTPSLAVDLAPFPIAWGDREAFLALRAHVKATAKRLKVQIRHISWDLPHTELA
jgi:peptidoglycan L-alanyl-D-glutamate endopeptidase CwlK